MALQRIWVGLASNGTSGDTLDYRLIASLAVLNNGSLQLSRAGLFLYIVDHKSTYGLGLCVCISMYILSSPCDVLDGGREQYSYSSSSCVT